MINNVTLIGRMTKDTDLRYTQSGKAVATFTLAVNRNFTNAQGEREADFIMCTAWDKTAELLAKYTNKGSLVGVEGRIQTRNYENNQGQRVYVTEVVANNVQFLDSKNDKSQSRQEQQQQEQGQFNQQNDSRDLTKEEQGKLFDDMRPHSQIEIDDDSLPF